MWRSEDQAYMQQAIALAYKGFYSTKPNPAVGCVLVKDGKVIGQGWHHKAGQPHAEKEALADALNNAQDVAGSTAYVTLEPCSHHGRTPPCSDALIDAGVSRVVVAMQDPNPLVGGNGIKRLQNAGIDVQVGLLEEEAYELNHGFLHRMRTGLPYVRLKMASSLDGRTAMANGESQWITGADSRVEVHKLRAQAGAVIIGIGTVLADDPSMTVRLDDAVLADMNLNAEEANPIRVVLDPNLSLPMEAKMLALPGRTIVMTSKETVENSSERVEEFHRHGVELVAVAAQDDRLDIESVLHYLADEEQVNDVMVETGAIVAGAFVESGFVNEIHAFVAPVLMGDQARPMFVLPSVTTMNDKLQFSITDISTFGDDVRMILKPKRHLKSN